MRTGTVSALVFLDNAKKVLDADKCVLQDIIIDTAVIVMLSFKLSKAVGVNFSTLNLGPKFVTT